jgi:hypothetical protein
MTDAGIDIGYVRVEPNLKTLFSVSFSTRISPGATSLSRIPQMGSWIMRCSTGAAGNSTRRDRMRLHCLPEVPLEARSEFLRIATECGSFRIASFATGEMDAVRSLDLLSRVDLLALNRDEAASLGALKAFPDDRFIGRRRISFDSGQCNRVIARLTSACIHK